jgi:hypothetical protein
LKKINDLYNTKLKVRNRFCTGDIFLIVSYHKNSPGIIRANAIQWLLVFLIDHFYALNFYSQKEGFPFSFSCSSIAFLIAELKAASP